jgi:biopolymer transport protein ExbD
MSIFKHRRREVPSLNLASLPDLIFTVLFFFMIVTHMRKVTLKVKYQVPAGTELTRLTKKSAVSYIYIGEREQASGDTSGRMFIQMNDKLVTIPEVMDYVTAERNRMSPADAQAMTVSIKADRRTDMGTVTDVKQALRRVGALRINYSAVKPPKKQ